MDSDWTDCTVADVAAPTRNAIVGGPFGSDLMSRDYVAAGVPVIRGANMGLGRWIDGEFVYISSSKSESLAANHASPGDLVFTQRGTLGQVAMVRDGAHPRYLVSQSQMKLTVDKRRASPLFLYYVFRSEEQLNYIRINAIQTGVPHTNLGLLKRTPLRLPPLPEQRAIAHILGTLDDKIELNRRTNETLEAMARALFKSWFVDFDPVHAKKAGRKPEGMDAETAALFPSSFAGGIPTGWHRAELPSVIDMKEGPGIMAADFRDSGVPLVRLAGLKSGVSVLAGCDYLDPLMVAKKWSQFALEPGDTLLSTSATLGLVTVVEEEGRGAIPYTGIIRMRSQPGGLRSRLIRHFLESRAFQEQVEAMGVGSVIRHFGPSHLKSMSIVVPVQTLQAAASDVLAPIDAHVAAARRESVTLAALRDALLPQLLSGSLRVPEAMRLVEKAL